MTAVLSVKLVDEKDKFTQKCVIPIRLFETSNLKIGDYVELKTSGKKYICRVYTAVQPSARVLVDDIVTSTIFNSCNRPKHCESIIFSDSVTPIKVLTFERIAVKIVFKSDAGSVQNCDKITYENVVREILTCLVVGKNCVVNCSGPHWLADFFNIHSIVISDAYPENVAYGRLLKTSKIEVIDIKTTEQMHQIDEFQNIQLGGMSGAMDILKLSLMTSQSCRILVTGPSGSGKSSLVKSFYSNIKCFFVIIDELSIGLNDDKCNKIHDEFSRYLKMFPNNICVLFIDHIDIITPYGSKRKSPLFVSMIVNLINSLKDLYVSVIACAVNKISIDSEVSTLFSREVNLGVPSIQQRKEIVKTLAKSLNCDINCDKIAQMTPGFVGRDILSLIKTAININKKTAIECLTDEDFEKALVSISPSILKTSVWNMKVKPVYWKDIGGMFSIKQKLQMCVEWPLRNPELFKKVDLPCPHGVLLFGPPGCCKTTLARGLATECNANFFAANPAQIYSSYVGESEKNIIELFYEARLCSPSIIFLDELDCLVSQRKLDKKSQGVGEKVLSALLNEMDGFGTKVQFQNNLNMQKLLHNDEIAEDTNVKEGNELHSNDDVIVVAATNRPDLIDDALLRPGRFDVILYVPPPNEEERESILLTLTKNMPVKNANVKNMAESTDFFSGADLKNLCHEATMNALRRDQSASYITEEDFSEALTKIKPSISRQQLEMYEKLSSKYGTVVR